MENWVATPRHVEVQLLGGPITAPLVHLCERDCTVQRRTRRWWRRAPAVFLTALATRAGSCAPRRSPSAAPRIPQRRQRFEFLKDDDSGRFYFIRGESAASRSRNGHPIARRRELVKGADRIADGRSASLSPRGAALTGQADSASAPTSCRPAASPAGSRKQLIPDSARSPHTAAPRGLAHPA